MSEENMQHIHPGEDDFSLKDLINKGLEYFFLLWRHKWLILFIGLLGAAALYLKAYLTPTTYSAPLTFALNEGDGNSSMGAISGLLGQFGLGGNTSGKVSMDKIVALSKSMRIVNKALFDKTTVNGKEDFIANHIIDLYKMDEKWAKYNPAYKGFRFKSDSLDTFTLDENSALKGIYWFTVGGLKPGLVTCNYDNESTIFTLDSKTENDALSLALTENIFNRLSRFYVQQSSDKQKQTFDLVKAKADSLFNAWTSSEYAVGKMDQTQGALWAPQDRTNKNIRSKQSLMYATAYTEALKNLEIADYALKNSTPFIREIDKPFFPLDAMGANRLRQSIIGLILGCGLAGAWVIGKNIVLKALKS